MALGAILRQERERRGLTERQVADATRMMVQMVRELEEEDFHRVAAPIYGRGFVKLYASFLEIDPDPLVKEFEVLYAQRNQKAPALQQVPLQRFGEGPESGLEEGSPPPADPGHDPEEEVLRIPSAPSARKEAPSPASDLFGDPIRESPPGAPDAKEECAVLTVSRPTAAKENGGVRTKGAFPGGGTPGILEGASRRFEARGLPPSGIARIVRGWLARLVSAVAKGLALVAVSTVAGCRRAAQGARAAGGRLRLLPWGRIGRAAAIVLPVLLLLWGAAWGFQACANRRATLRDELAGLSPTVVVERILPPPPGYAD